MDLFVNASLPPMEGIFYDGQIFDAYLFVSKLIKGAAKEIVLIDNYIDETVLTLLDKRESEVRLFGKAHDRFLIIDDSPPAFYATCGDFVKYIL